MLAVRESELLWKGEWLYRDAERGADAMPFLLHRDGVRELQFLPGFESEELPLFLELLQRSKLAGPNEDDLVTLLWVADFSTLVHKHVEVGTLWDANNVSANGAGIATFSSSDPQLAVAESESPSFDDTPAAIIRMEDFDATLHFLSVAELAYLGEEVRRAYATDGKRNVIGILLDIAETQEAPGIADEVIAILASLFVDLITSGEYSEVAELLREVRETYQRSSVLAVESRQQMIALSARLSEPAVLSQLLQALEESPRRPSPQTLSALFSELQPTALPVLLPWLATTPVSPARGVIEQAVTALSANHSAHLVQLLEHGDVNVVRGAVMVAARLKSQSAVPALAKLSRSHDPVMRAEAVVALGEIGSVVHCRHSNAR